MLFAFVCRSPRATDANNIPSGITGDACSSCIKHYFYFNDLGFNVAMFSFPSLFLTYYFILYI